MTRYDLAVRLILVVKTTVALANDHGLLDMIEPVFVPFVYPVSHVAVQTF